jgi:hypothetical protein
MTTLGSVDIAITYSPGVVEHVITDEVTITGLLVAVIGI